MINRPALPPEQLLALLRAVIVDAPRLRPNDSLSDEDTRWLGRADAILEASGAGVALAAFRVERMNLGSLYFDRQKLLISLQDAYHRIELMVPAASRGAFIPGGETWNGYAAIVELVQRECDDLVIVDPYLNSSLFTLLGVFTSFRCPKGYEMHN